MREKPTFALVHGGPQAGRVARAYWSAPTPERRQRYFETCLPFYSVTPMDPDVTARMIVKAPVAMHYNGPRNEMGPFDFCLRRAMSGWKRQATCLTRRRQSCSGRN